MAQVWTDLSCSEMILSTCWQQVAVGEKKEPGIERICSHWTVQGYLAHKKRPPPKEHQIGFAQSREQRPERPILVESPGDKGGCGGDGDLPLAVLADDS